MTDRPRSNQRIPELDGLRGLAVGAVVLFHLGRQVTLAQPILNKIISVGWTGVDLFFVMSGFLIGGILIDQRETEHYFRAFYARRVCRILPVYLLILAVYGVYWLAGSSARATLYDHYLPPMPWYVYLSFTNNFWISSHNTMFVFLAPSWSLAIEEQFYLTLPLVVRFVKPRHLLPLCVVLILAIFCARIAAGYSGHPGQGLYVLPWFREDALLIGVLCAIAVRNQKARHFIHRYSWSLYLLMAILAMALYKTGTTLGDNTESTPLLMFSLTLVAILYGALLLLAVVRPGPLCVFRFAPMMELGKVAYFTYLIHIAVISIIVRFLINSPQPFSPPAALFVIGTGLFVMFLIAQLSWGLFESRMIQLGHRIQYTTAAQPAKPEILPKLREQPSLPS